MKSTLYKGQMTECVIDYFTAISLVVSIHQSVGCYLRGGCGWITVIAVYQSVTSVTLQQIPPHVTLRPITAALGTLQPPSPCTYYSVASPHCERDTWAPCAIVTVLMHFSYI